MIYSFDLLSNAVVSGLLPGDFFAAVETGATISFGLLDIANIGHPAFVVFGAYCAFVLNQNWGIDPVLAGLMLMPAFFAVGRSLYYTYHHAFERRGDDATRGLAFFSAFS